MKLIELKAIVDRLCEQERNHDLNVCIRNNKRGMYGGSPVTNIKGCNRGIDWDKDKFFMFPEKEMIEMPVNQKSPD